MFASRFTQGYYVYTMCLDIIFQILLLCSRPMISHHVTCHVTAMSCTSSLSLKRKRNIKSRKIDKRKRKRKMLVSKVFYNITILRVRLKRTINIIVKKNFKVLYIRNILIVHHIFHKRRQYIA